MLMVTEERDPALIFARRGDDIPMLVATYDDVISGPWYGPESVWRYRGATVDIDHLKTVVARRIWWNASTPRSPTIRLTEHQAIAIPANER